MLTEELLAMEHSRARAALTSCHWHGKLWLCGRDQHQGLAANSSKIHTRLRRSALVGEGDMKIRPVNPGKHHKPSAL